jgi:AraC-like DNA-binding protein
MDLRPFIQHYWMVSWDLLHGETVTGSTIPHPTVHLVLDAGKSKIQGIRKSRFVRILSGRGGVFGIKFRPGGFYPFLRSPVSALTNRVLAATDLFGKSIEELEKAVFRLAAESPMIDTVETFIRERLPERDETAEFAGRIVDGILADREILSVDDVVARFHIGKRTLQRVFDCYVGVSPKWVIRTNRLHEVLERLNAGEALDFAALSQDLGYFDQAHFVRDFKSIVGQTPAEYARPLRK